MEFVLTGFRHAGNVREYTFEGVTDSRTRTKFQVDADLTMARRYGITPQELPLLCRRLLEAMDDDERPALLTFSEQDMSTLATDRKATAAAAALRKRPWHARKPAEGAAATTTATDRRS